MRSKHWTCAFPAMLLVCGTFTSITWADGVPAPPLACEPGHIFIEEIRYQEIVHTICTTVPDVKKTVKPVYRCKEEEICLPKCSHCKQKCGDCSSCPQCGKPRSRRVLVKKLVMEACPTSKCVIETVVEKVPYKILRMVPCNSVSLPPPVQMQAPVAAPAP